MSFKDYFSRVAGDYTRFRPNYPEELFSYLASLADRHKRAWDCATGNGQAALSLTEYFDEVIATDASHQQLDNAVPHEKITYRIALAEKTDIESASVDLVTIAQALHWLNIDEFFKEARRVLRPGGVIAFWFYRFVYVAPNLDALLEEFHEGIIKPYWLPETRIADGDLHSFDFPFEEIQPPQIDMIANWDLEHLIGFLGTWSAVQKFKDANNRDPIETISDRLQSLWGDPKTKRWISWPLMMRVGRLSE